MEGIRAFAGAGYDGGDARGRKGNVSDPAGTCAGDGVVSDISGNRSRLGGERLRDEPDCGWDHRFSASGDAGRPETAGAVSGRADGAASRREYAAGRTGRPGDLEADQRAVMSISCSFCKTCGSFDGR